MSETYVELPMNKRPPAHLRVAALWREGDDPTAPSPRQIAPVRTSTPVARRAESEHTRTDGSTCVVFKRVEDRRPYPDHATTGLQWARIPPRPVRLDQLVTTKNVLDLHTVLATDSTFYGDLFPHVICWQHELYLEDGLHRALRAALQQRSVLHVRVLVLG
jgi:Arc/MetJ family transcription regulator